MTCEATRASDAHLSIACSAANSRAVGSSVVSDARCFKASMQWAVLCIAQLIPFRWQVI